MKMLFLIITSLLAIPLSASADEYIDPACHVIYTYDPDGTTAEVKKGEFTAWDYDPWAEYVPGSPDASGDVVILEMISVNGKEYPVTTIGDYAFSRQKDLTRVSIPSSVMTIGREAFAECSSLEAIDMREGLREICMEAFRECISLKSITLPSGLETIGFATFYSCRGLKEIIIPESVREIGGYLLCNCSNLKNVTSLIEDPFPVDHICDFEQSQITLYVPKGCKTKYEETDGWNRFAQIKEMKMYDSFLDEEKVWTVKIEHLFNTKSVSYKEYKLMDKTSIDDISSRQLFTRDKPDGEDEWSEWQPGEFGGTTYISEDSDGKVYYDDTYMKNFLLMDFSMQVGDVYRFDDDYDVLPFAVTAVSDTILENSFDRKPRKCIHLSQIANGEILTEDYNRDIWIEGVGSVKHGLMGMRGRMISGGSRQLMKCTQQGNVIYQYDNTTSVQGIKEQPLGNTPTYNLQGVRVDQPKKGVYIQNGIKVVVK